MDEPWVDEAFEANLVADSDGKSIFEGKAGRVTISGISPSDVNGDVLLVNPRRGVADRLIRRNSPHNTFVITERCDQLCVMCSQPPKQHHVDLFSYFEAAALLAPPNAVIGLSGGEPTLYKGPLFGLLSRVMQQRPDISFHVLTNAQHFAVEDGSAIRQIDLRRVIWGVPLYSAHASIHDEIVGKAGAYDLLKMNLGLMARTGFRIELRTVLMQPNAKQLPELARLIATMLPFIDVWAIMQMENIGYGRKNWDRLFFDNSDQFADIATALNIVQSRGIEAKLYNFPLCTVPLAYRPLAPATISDWKNTYLDGCDGCSMKDACGGFFEWHPRNHGYRALGVL
ncbi:His-Xaa-Ser system radical SAM maturase HxsC [Brucella intermedia]|uniref:His-Xaa-Ser system radical SAM maturase HxsC n=1 Tax=Brucella intermedia TaxID=94625 RepID=UPI00224A5511|nr:His-Xaa-Ser system radical SAM maturase HxsC [Brucella intermedia]